MLVLGAVGCLQKCPAPTRSGTTIELQVGQTCTIIVEANPTTGYEWEMIDKPNPTVVKPIGNTYRSCTPVTAGSGGRTFWNFKALAPGRSKVKLEYYPPDSNNHIPTQTAIFTIIVH